MAEIKNTFLKSKMNKDLDDRLLPNGEYRDAQNISVGKSEDADVGALENIIGNASVTPNLPYGSDFEIIGYYSDPVNDRIITFVTNYTDPYTNGEPTYISDANKATPTPSPLYNSHICVFNQNTQDYNIVVSGEFLNFSTTDKVLGISLIEELLFFTDNRNQPRKINLTKPIGYYTSEDNISVAKYNPYQPISLVKKSKYASAATATGTNTVEIANSAYNNDLEVGMTVVGQQISNGTAITNLEGSSYAYVSNISTGATNTSITIDWQSSSITSFNIATGDLITFLKSTMTNEENTTGWPGDPDLIEDKYVRFSYRFKFDDGEYSIMAPFTQIAYVPKQKGYFFSGDEDAAYRSTILEFMENEINNVELLISLPSKGSSLESEYKVKSIDILYKESDDLVVKVLESVATADIISSTSGNVYTYNYQSRKPYKTLTEAETIRVYDKVPVRAQSQETSGNRIIYGNFYDQHTPPSSINYNVGVFDKDTVLDDSFVEYPNHTAKQNRNYQIGFVLADKFGRKSPVILSPVDLTGQGTGSSFKGGSTIFHPYNDGATQGDIRTWFGDQMQIIVNDTINSTKNKAEGTPGLYAIQQKNGSLGSGFAIATSTLNQSLTQLQFTLDSGSPANANVPKVGDYLRGEYRDYVKVTSVSLNAGTYTVDCDGEINSLYLPNALNSPDVKFSYILNQTGWYSYNIVVKQTEQEYYNCYLPGILDGYPTHGGTSPYPTNENGLTAHVVLLNDNINKIPRDLSEVGPDQKQYRSSVQLFGRVENYFVTTGSVTINTQYFPGRNTDTASTIATATDLNMGYAEISSTDNFYQLDTNPIIARISTLSGSIGVGAANMISELAIYETEPVVSLLDIFWETSTAGLISDLNEDVLTGFAGPVDITSPNALYKEFQDPNGSGTTTGANDSPFVTDWFAPLSIEGAEILNTGLLSPSHTSQGGSVSTAYTLNVTNEVPASVLNNFEVVQNITNGDPNKGKYRIKLKADVINHFDADTDPTSYNFSISVLDQFGDMSSFFNFSTSLVNINPYIYTTLNTPVASPYTLDQITINEPSGYTNIGKPNNTTNDLRSNGAWAKSGSNAHQQNRHTYLVQIPPRPKQASPSTIQLDHNTGDMSFNPTSSDQVGFYNWKLKIKDAMVNAGGTGMQLIGDNGTDSSGTLSSQTYTQPLRVLESPVPANCVTSCLPTFSSDSRQYAASYNSSNLLSRFGWYVAPNTVSFPRSASDYGYPGFGPTGSNFVSRLGTAGFEGVGTSATLLFDLMVEAERQGSGAGDVTFTWIIYYRANSGSSWSTTAVRDSNNSSPSTSGDLQNISLAKPQSPNGTKSSINIPFAVDNQGEYFIECEIRTFSSDTAARCWVNSTDANYPSCVPLYGNNMVGSGSGRDVDYFAFQRTAANGGFGAATCNFSFESGLVYARTPYAHILPRFFSNTSLSEQSFTPTFTDGYRSYLYNPASVGQKSVFSTRMWADFKEYQQTLVTSNTYGTNTYKTDTFVVNTTLASVSPRRSACSGGLENPRYLFSNY